MKTILKPNTLGIFFSLLLLCSCATQRSSFSNLPPEVSFNTDAGRGNLLIVNLHLESGEELPLVVDTGTSATFFDKSLEPKLGNPIGTAMINSWGKHEKKNVYAMPKLYLAGIPLMTGSNVITFDFKHLSGRADHPALGILGMDVLKNYCVQLDFAAGKMRFLNSKEMDKKTLGRAFPIVALNAKDDRPSVDGNFFGARDVHSLIDSGYDADGWLMPTFFQRWTNNVILATKGESRSPDGMFGEEIYQNISLRMQNVESDGVGLHFLARHLVTLDFPRQTLYLKRTRPTSSNSNNRSSQP